jgi:hypothetical protein
MKSGRRSGAVSTASLAVGAAAAAIVGLSALGGRWAAGDDAAPHSRIEGSLREPALGPVQLAVPPEWRRLPARAAGIAGIEKLPTQVFDRASGLSARTVVAVAPLESTASPSLIPEPLQAAAARPPGRPRAVRLDGRPAWTYVAAPVRRGDEMMEVTVLPTTAGVVAIACIAPTLALSAAADCASELELTFRRARAIRPAPDLGFRFRIGTIARRLDRERVEQRATLARVRTPRAQARAAHRLAVQHAGAARALAPFARSDTTVRVVASLREASRGYEQLSRSATADDRAAFALASRAIDEADDRLTEAWGAVLRPVDPAPRTKADAD